MDGEFRNNRRFSTRYDNYSEQDLIDELGYLPPSRSSTWKSGSQTAPLLAPRASVSNGDYVAKILRQGCAKKAKAKFFEVIMDGRDAVGDQYFTWYCRFLEDKIAQIQYSHLNSCVSRTLSTQSDEKGLVDLCIVYCLLSTVASMILSDPSLSLSNIVDELISRSIFLPREDLLNSKMNQLVFMILGWLSMLYCPEQNPADGKFHIKDECRSKRRSYLSKPRAVQQNFSAAYQPLQHLFRAFGDIIPSISTPQYEAQTHSGNRELLIHSYLNFHTLSWVCGVKVEWVDSLNAHLEFIESERILRIFRFPSFCYMLYRSGQDEPFLQNLISPSSSIYDELQQVPNVKDYLREMLLSYRLLFGQKRGSWKAFNARELGPLKRKSASCPATYDPLLPRICGRGWRSELRTYYMSLDAEEAPPTHYSLEQDFPCLGSKLLKLQRFSADQHPHNLWKLYWDRRDMRQWVTFWAVFWVGGGTILVGIAQMILAVLQLFASYEQNNLQAAQLNVQMMGIQSRN